VKIPHCLLSALFALPVLWPAHAQQYPTKSIRIVVPFPPGGGTDILARALGPKFTETWGQPVVVDNRPGANGNIAGEFVAKSAPDGYTLVVCTVGTHAINPAIYPKMPYDPVRDFTAITNLVMLPSVLVVHPALPVRTVQDLVALAKKRPGQLNYSSAGSGSQPHLTAEMFKTMTKTDILHVPYKGATPQMIDAVAGHVAMTFATATSGVPFVKTGQLRALGVTTPVRVAALPDIPTIAESGVPGYEAVGWSGLLGPAGIPATIVDRLNTEVVRIVKLPDVHARLIGLGTEPKTTTPAEFSAYIRSEVTKWAKVVKDSGARLD
jgi:tripartite-type tricarboxylate transporter receptor subunit TctC